MCEYYTCLLLSQKRHHPGHWLSRLMLSKHVHGLSCADTEGGLLIESFSLLGLQAPRLRLPFDAAAELRKHISGHRHISIWRMEQKRDGCSLTNLTYQV